MIKKFDNFLNESKEYRVFNSPNKVIIEGKPDIWGMLGPLPDNVIDYINKNSKYVVDYRNGEYVLNSNTKKPYIKYIKGKNHGDYYFFDEITGNCFMEHERFVGKAVILTPEEWNLIFN